MLRSPFVLLFAGLGLAACRDDATSFEGPDDHPECRDGDETRERHGTDCSCCHSDFGFSGSVADDEGIARVRVSDSAGVSFDVAVNPYGNFFRHVELTPPVSAAVVLRDGSVVAMRGPADGKCNACHFEGSSLGLIGAPPAVPR